jgi:tetratricopeptide (TPR) repeat protein
MPYVRSHGNQVAIVHGGRDKSTGKVQQRTLFTLYSKLEASAAIGESNPEDARYFQQLLQEANPEIKFEWHRLGDEIRARMESLPDLYPLRQVRTHDTFQKAMDGFLKQLILIDPCNSASGRATLKEYADDLNVLVELINTRLQQRDWTKDMEESPFDQHDPFCWRYEVQNESVPDDVEELAQEHYRSGRYDEAKRIFHLLVRCFPSYAEGYNYLGLIALEERNPKEAVEHFRTTVKVGRKLFPPRMAKANYWSDLSTRPYMRGLMNLALALVQTERYKEALEVCDQLDRECGAKGKDAASAHRASAHLNLHNWQECLNAADELIAFSPGEGFVAGYALFELQRHAEALELFLFAAFNNPHTACLLLDLRKPKPENSSEIDDHNSGLHLCRSLPRFFATQSRQSRKFFRKLAGSGTFKSILDEVHQCTRNHHDRTKSTRESFDRWHQIRKIDFAKKTAKQILAEFGAK